MDKLQQAQSAIARCNNAYAHGQAVGYGLIYLAERIGEAIEKSADSIAASLATRSGCTGECCAPSQRSAPSLDITPTPYWGHVSDEDVTPRNGTSGPTGRIRCQCSKCRW